MELSQEDPKVAAAWDEFWEEVTYSNKELLAQEWMARAAFWRGYNEGYRRGRGDK